MRCEVEGGRCKVEGGSGTEASRRREMFERLVTEPDETRHNPPKRATGGSAVATAVPPHLAGVWFL